MIELQGIHICDGIVSGRLFFYDREEDLTIIEKTNNPALEKERFVKAVSRVNDDLEKLNEVMVSKSFFDGAGIFDVHKLIINGDEYTRSVTEFINEGYSAEYALTEVGRIISKQLKEKSGGDEIFAERGIDIEDITVRLRDALRNDSDRVEEEEDYRGIIMADELLPSEVINFYEHRALAFVVRKPSAYSHMAILSRTMNIPAVSGIDVLREYGGKNVIVDGFEGRVIIEPTEEMVVLYDNKYKNSLVSTMGLDTLIGKENITLSGKRIDIAANINLASEVSNVLENDASGIGLMRSELLFIDRDRMPSEDEQFEVYKNVLVNMYPKPVTIRTLDIGADKMPSYFECTCEANPQLGLRGIRFCLENEEVLKTQLRALYRASKYGNLSIMYPMINSVDDVRRIKKISYEIKDEMKAEAGGEINVREGIMIETPAAAIISDELAGMVDFFSIGTNDLAQYTLAADRQSAKMQQFFDRHHKAVLRLIDYVSTKAHEAGIKVSICGELAADITLTEEFIRLGIDELSVPYGDILKIRNTVRNIE